MNSNCEYATYQEWVALMVQDPEMSAFDVGYTVKRCFYEDASIAEMQLLCDAGKRAVLAAQKKVKDKGYIRVLKVGGGRGNRSVVAPNMPDGRIVLFDEDEHISEYKEEEKTGADAPEKLSQSVSNRCENAPVSENKVVQNCLQTGADTHQYVSPSSPQRNIYSNPPPTPSSPSIPQTGDGRNFWSETLSNDSFDTGVRFENGQVRLINGTRQLWVQRFGSEERLQIVLDGMIGKIRPRSGRPVEHQVIAILSEKAADKIDRDNRYQAAAKRNNAGNYGVDDDLKKMKLIAGER